MLSILTAALLVAEPALALESPSSEPQAPVGQASLAPAVLPQGSLALFTLLGAPDLGAGYRQGFRPLELDATASVNYLQLSFTAELATRLQAYTSGNFQLGAVLGLGFVANSGSTYYDAANFALVGLRPRLGLVASHQAMERLALLATADLPLAIGLSSAGVQSLPSLGAGAEFTVGGGVSLLALGQLGVDASRSPAGVSTVRLGWAVRFGVGFRLF